MFKIIIDPNLCKGCRLCVYECPTKSIIMSNSVNHYGQYIPVQDKIELCTGCSKCAIVCPETAIKIIKIEK